MLVYHEEYHYSSLMFIHIAHTSFGTDYDNISDLIVSILTSNKYVNNTGSANRIFIILYNIMTLLSSN
jgi:hypothetical protein